MCYEFSNNSLWLSIAHYKLWTRYSLDITGKFGYTKDGETKKGFCSIYLNLIAAKVLVDQLPLAYHLSKKLQDNQCVEIYNIFYLKYVIHFSTGQPQMTAKDSPDGVLGDLTEDGATAAWKIANVVLGGWGLTHAGVDLQGFGNLGDVAKPLYVSNSGPVSNKRLANAGIATTQSCNLPKKTRLKSKKATVKPILGRINAPRLPNGRYQKLQLFALPESSSACPSPTTCSKAVASTWTSAPDATSTSPMMSSSSTTPSFSDLASTIFSTFILDHLKYNSNLEVNLYKIFIVNSFILNSFYFSTMHCPPSRIHINHTTQSFPLRFVFLVFNKF